MPCGWIFACIIGNGRSTKVNKNNCHTLTFDLFTARSNLLLYAFVWAPYICMEKMLIISNDFSSEASGPVLLIFHAEPPWAGPVPEMSATGLAYAADICGLTRKSLRKLAYVRRCPLQICRCPCLCQRLRTSVDIFPYQLGLSFCGRPQLCAS